MEKLQAINEMKHKLVDMASAEVTKGISGPDELAALGEVVDMIKDLAEAEKACLEGAYYEGMGGEREGYDDWRYASGRFAPKGRGTRSGYTGRSMLPDPYAEARADGTTGRTDRDTEDRRGNPVYGYHAGEGMDDAVDAVRSMWDGASKEERKKMRDVVSDLLYEMEQAR